MRKKFIIITTMVVLFTIVTVKSTDVSAASTGFKVVEVLGPDKAKVIFHGLPVIVRLANVKSLPEAKNLLEELIDQKTVTFTYADELGTDESDVPYVYMGVGPALARKFVNIELIEQGLADYDCTKAQSKRYNDRFNAALAKAKQAKRGIWSGAIKTKTDTPEQVVAHVKPATITKPAITTSLAAKGRLISELNSHFYHLSTCPIASRLSKRSLIRYTSPEAAERAGKRPCARCMVERSRQTSPKSGTRAIRWPGKLIGLKSDPTYFYSPVSPKLKKVSISDMIGFNTLKEAKASGRKPDPISLRLTGLPGYPTEKPEPGECIGRALPYYRPCRRAPADESGLCLECQRGE